MKIKNMYFFAKIVFLYSVLKTQHEFLLLHTVYFL